MHANAVKGHLDLVVLASLRDEPGHGYAIIGRLRERTGGELVLLEGTLYPILHRLETAGLVASDWTTVRGRRRRVYRLTRRGGAALGERTAAWREAVRTVDLVLGGAA
jgi:PadR family transcriptional regulator, regulatory protein PadR